MWQAAKATFIRNHVSNKRAYPWTFTFGHLIEGAYIVLVSYFSYHFLIKGELDNRFAHYTGSDDYLTFAIIGGLLSVLSVSTMMNISRALITEWREGTLDVLLLAPGRRSGYFLGTTLQQLTRTGLEFAVILGIGWCFGLRIPDAHWPSAILGMVLFLGACFSVALVLGSIMLLTRDTYIVQNTLFSVTALVCGFLFPVQYLPVWLQFVGQALPLTQALHVLRDSLLTGTPIWQHPQAVLSAIVLILLYGTVGGFWLKYVERTVFERKMA